ncbi:MAG TPA: hypothetical protein VES73_13285, partial [Lamprocystis sp. (in: g-proteobacteria)]|nr:hypothetical protein [Lamprocystis sp. (in: g-proteobacteria)]
MPQPTRQVPLPRPTQPWDDRVAWSAILAASRLARSGLLPRQMTAFAADAAPVLRTVEVGS